MIPQRIEIENFLSFGTPPVELCFDEESLWVLSGPNGVGKSAIFDAITYALFGEHRGGAVKAEKLIRHGANGFRIVFEFEFDGIEYRITRTRSGKTTQKVERCSRDGDWVAIDLPSGRDAVKVWAEQTLGLGFDAFTASVLLRQGQADAIITSPPSDRLKMLKKVINAERFERLSQRVHEVSRRLKDRLEDLQTRRDGLVPVTTEQLAEGEKQLARVEQVLATARVEETAAVDRVRLAKQWEDLEKNRSELERSIREADDRASEANRIREQAARLDLLASIVPKLRTIVTLRARITSAEGRLCDLNAQAALATTGRDARKHEADVERQKAELHARSADQHENEAKRLRIELDQDKKIITLADEIAGLRRQLAGFTPELDSRILAASEKARVAAEDEAKHRDTKAMAEGLLSLAKQQQEKFADVSVGMPCSLCGQDVSEGHAQRERDRLDTEVRAQGERLRAAEAGRKSAAAVKDAAQAEASQLTASARERDKVRHSLTVKQETLAGFTVSEDPEVFRSALISKAAEADRHEQRLREERSKQKTAEAEMQRLAGEQDCFQSRLKKLAEESLVAHRTLAVDQGQHDTLVGQLPDPWPRELPTLDEDALGEMAREQSALAADRVTEALAQLQQDATRRDEWAKRLAEVTRDIDRIPPAARVAVGEAERSAKEAKVIADEADRDRDETKETLDGLRRCVEAMRELKDTIHVTQRQHDLHKKLDDLLGNAGLQRELVRQAEREIVRLANDTVRNLSDGDLTLDLEQESDDDKALALRVRRLDDSAPIEVSYLSGSQKFRVSVAVALAIGRFAAGQARPIDSVIIDEGFGSLDRDGLRAAADELNCLKQHLRRIILVSHQEEFAERFSVGYKLSAGENGTIAERFRR